MARRVICCGACVHVLLRECGGDEVGRFKMGRERREEWMEK